jgi:hypothetical protein
VLSKRAKLYHLIIEISRFRDYWNYDERLSVKKSPVSFPFCDHGYLISLSVIKIIHYVAE